MCVNSNQANCHTSIIIKSINCIIYYAITDVKKINADRNRKTTRNIQDGLLFDIDSVKKQIHYQKMTAKVRCEVFETHKKPYRH